MDVVMAIKLKRRCEMTRIRICPHPEEKGDSVSRPRAKVIRQLRNMQVTVSNEMFIKQLLLVLGAESRRAAQFFWIFFFPVVIIMEQVHRSLFIVIIYPVRRWAPRLSFVPEIMGHTLDYQSTLLYCHTGCGGTGRIWRAVGFVSPLENGGL